MDDFNALCSEIGSEGFNENVGCFLLDFGNGRSDMGGTAINQVYNAQQSAHTYSCPQIKVGHIESCDDRLTISINTCQHDIAKSPSANCFSSILGLMDVQWRRRLGSLDRAKSTSSCTLITHQLVRKRSISPAHDRIMKNRGLLTIIVAVAFPLPPPQHSPMLGHLASSHTVCNPNPRSSFFIPL